MLKWKTSNLHDKFVAGGSRKIYDNFNKKMVIAVNSYEFKSSL